MEFVWTRSQRIRLHMYHLYNYIYIYAFSCRRRPVRSPLLVFYLFCILSFVLVFPNATVSGRCWRTVAVTFSVCSPPVFPLHTTTFFHGMNTFHAQMHDPVCEKASVCVSYWVLWSAGGWQLAEDELACLERCLSVAIEASGGVGVQGPLA